MSEMNLGLDDKQRVQRLIEQLAEDDPEQAQRLLREAANRQAPIWRRYIDAGVHQPITWWMGIIQVLMILGTFGHKHQMNAQIRQSLLSQVLARGGQAAENATFPDDLIRIVTYIVQHRTPELAGRLTGSAFTNYASGGGRVGIRARKATKTKLLTVPQRATNFAVASFGSLIAQVQQGLVVPDDIVLAVLTGNTGTVPKDMHQHLSPKARQEIDRVNREFDYLHSLAIIQALNDIHAKPVPMADFCADPANVTLRGDWCE